MLVLFVALGLCVLGARSIAAASGPSGSDSASVAKKKGKKGKGKKGKGKTKKYKGPKIPTPSANRCDFLDTTVCLQPFPNSLYLKKDKSTPTGVRVNFNAASMPKNVNDIGIDPTDLNRNDGFSPGQAITLHIKGLDNQQAFDKSKLVSLDEPAAYKDKKQSVVVIDAKTGKRHPVWAEMDTNATEKSDNNLIIRPLRNWDEGATYVVAIGKLKKSNGKKIKAPNAFKVYRDKLKTKQKKVENRRSYFEKKVFKPLAKKKAKVKRKNLYMAWDFSVASEESLTSRALAMRDDAFAQLGDTNLSDGVIQGDSPDFTITDEIDNPSAEILKRVEGTIDNIPCYMDEDGCPSGSQFAYDGPNDTTPNFNPAFTVDVPFECNIPSSVDGGSSVDPARPTLYGHGLLGNKGQAHSGYTREFAAAHNIMHCAVDFAGFSDKDLGAIVIPSLSDVSNFTKGFDLMQQGYVNFMMLGRAMFHPAGFAADPAFQYDAGSGDESVIDTSALYYYGNSQGGIMGGALTALSPDFTQSVLGVPGMNYSTLLRRSVDFDDYAELPTLGLYDNYPDEGERVLLLGLMQMGWDRGEANGYAHHMTTDPLPDTPEHNVLMHLALGDHQVANVTAEVEARTIGANVMEPGTDPGRHWESNPFFQIPAIGSYPFNESAMVYWDGGPVGFVGTRDDGTAVPPIENIAPRTEEGYGDDPHSYPRYSAEAQQQMSDWLQPGNAGAIQEACATGACYANGWTGP